MEKASKQSRTQLMPRILLLVVITFNIILRIRKMIHASMIGEDPTGFDWYVLFIWLISIFLLIGEFLWKRGRRVSEQTRIRVSRKKYREKQNHAMGPLVVAVMAFLMVIFNGYQVLFSNKEVGWELALWMVLIPVMIVIWTVRERRLKNLEIEE